MEWLGVMLGEQAWNANDVAAELNGAAGDLATSRIPSAWPAVGTTASDLSHPRKMTNRTAKGMMMTDDEKKEFAKRGRSWKELDDAVRRLPLDDAKALGIARTHLDKGLSWAPHITRCNDLEILALIRAVEAAHGIGDA